MNDVDPFDRALERLLMDESPKLEAGELDAEEQRMLLMAQLLRGSQPPRPDQDATDRIRRRVMALPRRTVVTRRTAFLSGLGALAAGIAGALGLDHLIHRSSPADSGWHTALVSPDRGRWFDVASVSSLPDKGVRSFQAGAVQGYLFKEGNNYWAISRMCTHMGCRLNFNAHDQRLVCPCHGAQFNLDGELRYESYKVPLAPLPEIKVRVKGDSVQVLGA